MKYVGYRECKGKLCTTIKQILEQQQRQPSFVMKYKVVTRGKGCLLISQTSVNGICLKNINTKNFILKYLRVSK